jgi:glutamate carboxypeptidase
MHRLAPRPLHRLLVAFLPVFLAVVQPARAEDPVVRAVADAVDALQPEARALLAETVAINSGTMNFAGVRAVGERFVAPLTALGFTLDWIDGEPFGRAGHLLAARGSRGPKLLLIGHLDTVFPVDGPFQAMETVAPGRVRGPGITDMKGGNVVLLTALQALDRAGQLDALQVRVFLAGDEEDRGEPLALATAPLVEAARWADYAIGFEDGDGDPGTAVIARRGSSSWCLAVSGRPAHSSQIFRRDVGYGAAFELARILDGWRVALAGEENLTFNAGLLLAGTELSHEPARTRGVAFGKDNVIPQAALASGGIRALTPRQLERAVATMERIAGEHLAGTGARFEFTEGYPPMPPTAGNEALLALYSEGSKALGFGPVRAVDPRRAGAADISFAAPYVRAAIDGLGLMGEGGHTVDETATMATLPSQGKRAALLMLALARGAGPQ